MSGYYPDKPLKASDGKAFEALGVRLFWQLLGETIEVFTDKESQLYVGESRQGVEFKELKKSHKILRIEVAEKTEADKAWVPSGIMRADNTVRYCCGNEQDVWVFVRDDLRRWHDANVKQYVLFGQDQARPTIKSFELDKYDAHKIFLYRFCLSDRGDWTKYVGPGDTAHEIARLTELFGERRVVEAIGQLRGSL